MERDPKELNEFVAKRAKGGGGPPPPKGEGEGDEEEGKKVKCPECGATIEV